MPSFCAVAQSSGFAAGFDTLYRIDLRTAQAQRIGVFGNFGPGTPIGDVEGLALAADGSLFGVSDNIPGGAFLRVDTATGAATIIGNLGIDGSGAANENLDFGLAFTCDGRLWLSSDTRSTLWEVDRANGAARVVGGIGRKISGLAARGNQLFGVGVEDDAGLYRIDTGTAAATTVATFTGAASFPDAGLDFDGSGTLYGVLDFFPPTPRSDLVRIDAATGALTSIGTISGSGLDDKEIETLAIAAPTCTNPQPGTVAQASVPANSTWGLALLGFVLALLGLARVRRLASR
jgi:hypothetical protein